MCQQKGPSTLQVGISKLHLGIMTAALCHFVSCCFGCSSVSVQRIRIGSLLSLFFFLFGSLVMHTQNGTVLDGKHVSTFFFFFLALILSQRSSSLFHLTSGKNWLPANQPITGHLYSYNTLLLVFIKLYATNMAQWISVLYIRSYFCGWKSFHSKVMFFFFFRFSHEHQIRDATFFPRPISVRRFTDTEYWYLGDFWNFNFHFAKWQKIVNKSFLSDEEMVRRFVKRHSTALSTSKENVVLPEGSVAGISSLHEYLMH